MLTSQESSCRVRKNLGGIISRPGWPLLPVASFAAVLGTVASGFEAVRGEMSREMEGVKMVRQNQPGLLENLRRRHNTVKIELMKQAVKFDNFNLSIDQMGTFLAFAQQQERIRSGRELSWTPS